MEHKEVNEPANLITISKVTKRSYSFLHQHVDIKQWITSSNFKNGAHLVLGPTRSGKTTFSALLLFAIRKYDPYVKLIIVTGSESIIKTIDNGNTFFPNKISDYVRYSTIEQLTDLYTDIKIKAETSPNRHYLVFFDDCYAEIQDKRYLKFFSDFSAKHRQYKITSIYNVQQLQNIPTIIKSNLASFSFTGNFNEKQAKTIYEYSGFGQVFNPVKMFSDFTVHDRGDIFNTPRCVLINTWDKLIKTYTVPTELANVLTPMPDPNE